MAKKGRVRDVKGRKNFILAIVCVSFAFPMQSLAVESQDEIGIGFSQTVPQPNPTPINKVNVIPLTSSYKKTQPLTAVLPKTGEQLNRNFQLLGICCLLSSFWLFLFLRLKKEEEYE